MRLFSRHIYIGVVLACLFSCGQGGKTTATSDGDTLKLRHAKLLQIVKHKDYCEVSVADPWKNDAILHKYILAEKCPDGDVEGTFVKTPLQRTIVFTAAHCGLFGELGAKTAVAGVCDKQYIMAGWVRGLPDCGNAMNPNIERIITLKPDGILLSPFQNSGGYGKVEQLGVPIIEAADYMETSALGRAEWMLFYGMLVGKEKEARKIFDEIEENYSQMSKEAKKCSQKSPLVMVDMKQSSSWYVPGGKSTLGKMILDAGGSYAFADDNRSGSIPLSIETMLELNHDADVWLIKYNAGTDISLHQLASDNQSYSKFKAFKDGNVYGCNTQYVPFYEEVPFHPDWLLKDYIRMFNNKSDSLRYYKCVGL